MNSNYKMKAMDFKVYDIEPLDTYIIYRKCGNPLDTAKENISTMP